MNLAIELLSQTVTLTDLQPGAGVKSETPVSGTDGTRFEDFMSRGKTENTPEYEPAETPRRERMEGTVTRRKSFKPEESVKEAEDEGEPDGVEEAIAGLMNQNRVVFILEGDSEAIPEISIDAVSELETAESAVGLVTEELELPVTADAELTDAGTEFALPETEVQVPDAEPKAELKVEPETEPVVEPETEPKAVETKARTPETTHAAEPQVAESVKKTETETEVTEDTGVGEVVARTPKIETAEESGTGEKNPENKENPENGDLSPLENKNETVKESKSKREKIETPVKEEVKPAETVQQQQVTDIKPEKVQAVEQLRQAVPNTPVTTENMFEAMVDHIDYMKASDTSEAAIRLKPEFLGEISLRISMGAEGLNIKIDAGDKDVRSMINNQIAVLVEELSNKGIEVAKVEVAYTGLENGAYKDPQEKEQPQKQRSGRGTVSGITADDVGYALNALEEMAGYVDMEISSVEYRA